MEISLNLFETLTIAVGVLCIGKATNNSNKTLRELCIPEAVTGGFIFSIITLLLYLFYKIDITFSSNLAEIFMIMFFTTVGYSASLKLLKRAGKPVFMFLIAAIALAVFQNLVGIGMASVLHINPLLGLATGSLSTTGGPGTAGAFAPILEAAGGKGATLIAMTTATYALIAGSIISGPVAKKLIIKHNLIDGHKNASSSSDKTSKKLHLNGDHITKGLFQIIIAMGVGSLLSDLFVKLGLILPSYLGAMIIAAIIRNINDFKKVKFLRLDEINIAGSFSLSIFLSLTLMSFKLWELTSLALPLIVMLIVQTLLMATFSYYITFALMGRDYDAAVMVSGHCGCGFGTTPKALANMEALTTKYLPSPKSFFVIPLVGGLFIDFFNVAIITFFINLVS